MRDTASKKRGPARIAVLTVPTILALGASLLPPAAQAQDFGGLSSALGSSTDYLDNPGTTRTPVKTTYPVISGLPEGVSVDHVDWLTSRRIAIFIKSAAMPEELIQVQVLLARDWNSDPSRTFPSIWMLDGLRAQDDESGWTINTNVEQFYADKNINVILPVGGQSSFYSDWQQPNNGKNYQWESFLINELIPVLREGFRTNDDRAIVGLSMGGTAAVNIAERHPSLFKFVGSFSGYLDTTSLGMPAAIAAAQRDAGGFDSTAMWGQAGSQDWIDHDPKLGVADLKGMSVYVSAGSGKDDYGTPGSVAKGPANYAGVGLEALSRMTTDTFVRAAKDAGIPVTAVFRPTGVHDWPYWQFEMAQSWSQTATALGLSDADRGTECTSGGELADVASANAAALGGCLTSEYDIEGGKAQDFLEGRVFYSTATGAHALWGAISALYNQLGAEKSWLGFPTSEEMAIKDGGRFVRFQNGNIYWSPTTGAVAVPNDIIGAWGELNWENGELGYPTAEAEAIDGGLVQQFQNGYVVRTADGKNYWLRGEIAKKYGEMDTASSALGYPVGNERLINGGAFQEFENGNIYWSATTGAHYILKGAIFNAWGTKQWEQGAYGYPTSDQTNTAGVSTVTFQHGTITEVAGVVKEDLK